MSMPKWMEKYPCASCGTGHGACSQFWIHNLMCCKDCQHPGYAEAGTDRWTAAEWWEMWKDHGPGAAQIKEHQRLLQKEAQERESQ